MACREPTGRGSSNPVCHPGARARASARIHGLVPCRASRLRPRRRQASLWMRPPSEPTKLRTSSRLTALFIGKPAASIKKPSSSSASDPFGASTESDVVFSSRNSISAAPNIFVHFHERQCQGGRAALRLDLTRTLNAFALHAGFAAHTHRSHHNLRRRNRQGKQMSFHRYNDHITLHT